VFIQYFKALLKEHRHDHDTTLHPVGFRNHTFVSKNLLFFKIMQKSSFKDKTFDSLFFKINQNFATTSCVAMYQSNLSSVLW